METFAPLIAAHGEGGHVVNTASVNGMMNTLGIEPYTATKFAIVGMSEGWAAQLAPQNIGLSILCPGMVETGIIQSRRNRLARYGPDAGDAIADSVADAALAGSIAPELVADRVIEAIRDNDLYVFTHVEYRQVLQARFDRIIAAFDKSLNSPALSVLGSREHLVDLIPR
jgi:NAD(P)-dependent dehydrogenase (short-subunit alcohol dehydrogenase family)